MTARFPDTSRTLRAIDRLIGTILLQRFEDLMPRMLGRDTALREVWRAA